MSHQRQLVVVPGGAISFAHTLLAGSAFGGAFVLACLFHFKEVCKNAVAGTYTEKEGMQCDRTVTDRHVLLQVSRWNGSLRSLLRWSTWTLAENRMPR
jgi:hypothetical protein